MRSVAIVVCAIITLEALSAACRFCSTSASLFLFNFAAETIFFFLLHHGQTLVLFSAEHLLVVHRSLIIISTSSYYYSIRVCVSRTLRLACFSLSFFSSSSSLTRCLRHSAMYSFRTSS